METGAILVFAPVAIPESEAELVAMLCLLDAYDIPHFVHNRHFGGLYPGNPAPLFTLQRIMVSMTHIAEAKQLLAPFFAPPLPYETERRLAFRDRARGVAEFLLTGWAVGVKRWNGEVEHEDG